MEVVRADWKEEGIVLLVVREDVVERRMGFQRGKRKIEGGNKRKEKKKIKRVERIPREREQVEQDPEFTKRDASQQTTKFVVQVRSYRQPGECVVCLPDGESYASVEGIETFGGVFENVPAHRLSNFFKTHKILRCTGGRVSGGKEGRIAVKIDGTKQFAVGAHIYIQLFSKQDHGFLGYTGSVKSKIAFLPYEYLESKDELQEGDIVDVVITKIESSTFHAYPIQLKQNPLLPSSKSFLQIGALQPKGKIEKLCSTGYYVNLSSYPDCFVEFKYHNFSQHPIITKGDIVNNITLLSSVDDEIFYGTTFDIYHGNPKTMKDEIQYQKMEHVNVDRAVYSKRNKSYLINNNNNVIIFENKIKKGKYRYSSKELNQYEEEPIKSLLVIGKLPFTTYKIGTMREDLCNLEWSFPLKQVLRMKVLSIDKKYGVQGTFEANPRISCICPIMHSPISCKVNDIVTCRIMAKTMNSNKYVVTCKKLFINAQDEEIVSESNQQEGYGMIVAKITDSKYKVSFFENFVGYFQDDGTAYQVGDIYKFKVTSKMKNRKCNVILSSSAGSAPTDSQSLLSLSSKSSEPIKLLEHCKIMKVIDKKGICLEHPNYNIFISRDDFSDNSMNSLYIFNNIISSMQFLELDNVYLIANEKLLIDGKQYFKGTLKSVRKESATFTTSWAFSPMSENSSCVGIISKIQDIGVTIAYPSTKKTSFIPRLYCYDEFISSPKVLNIKNHDLILHRIIRKENKKCISTIRSSILQTSLSESEKNELQLQKLIQHLIVFKTYHRGNNVLMSGEQFKVIDIKPYGIILETNFRRSYYVRVPTIYYNDTLDHEVSLAHFLKNSSMINVTTSEVSQISSLLNGAKTKCILVDYDKNINLYIGALIIYKSSSSSPLISVDTIEHSIRTSIPGNGKEFHDDCMLLYSTFYYGVFYSFKHNHLCYKFDHYHSLIEQEGQNRKQLGSIHNLSLQLVDYEDINLYYRQFLDLNSNQGCRILLSKIDSDLADAESLRMIPSGSGKYYHLLKHTSKHDFHKRKLPFLTVLHTESFEQERAIKHHNFEDYFPSTSSSITAYCYYKKSLSNKKFEYNYCLAPLTNYLWQYAKDSISYNNVWLINLKEKKVNKDHTIFSRELHGIIVSATPSKLTLEITNEIYGMLCNYKYFKYLHLMEDVGAVLKFRLLHHFHVDAKGQYHFQASLSFNFQREYVKQLSAEDGLPHFLPFGVLLGECHFIHYVNIPVELYQPLLHENKKYFEKTNISNEDIDKYYDSCRAFNNKPCVEVKLKNLKCFDASKLHSFYYGYILSVNRSSLQVISSYNILIDVKLSEDDFDALDMNDFTPSQLIQYKVNSEESLRRNFHLIENWKCYNLNFAEIELKKCQSLPSTYPVNGDKAIKATRPLVWDNFDIYEDVAQSSKAVPVPIDNEDYRKQLVQNPNDSILWIKYIQSECNQGNYQNARALFTKALNTINYTELKEIENIHFARVSYELEYGNQSEFKSIFNEILSKTNRKRLYLHLIKQYEHRKNYAKVLETLEEGCKRVKNKKTLWIYYLKFLMSTPLSSRKQKPNVDEILHRALQALPIHKHSQVMIQLGILYFSNRLHDKGRETFEYLLSKKPKRYDIWSIYINQEAKHGNVESTRELYKRLITISFSISKMKKIFNNYLEFEIKNNDAEQIEFVTEQAKQFLQTQT